MCCQRLARPTLRFFIGPLRRLCTARAQVRRSKSAVPGDELHVRYIHSDEFVHLVRADGFHGQGKYS